MAAHRQVLLMVAVVLAAAPLASATQWTVGDDGGWRAKFNQTGWADGKTFRVGDSLLFTYSKENHTVAQVGKEAFAGCDLSSNQQLGFWDSGSDVIQLDKPGKVWFICTKPNHCLNGMKLVIDVVSDGGPAAAPGPFTFPFPRQAPAPAPFPFPFPFPFPRQAPAPAPSSPFPFPLWGPAPAPASQPSSAAVMRYPVGGAAVAAAAAIVVAAALAF